MKTAKEWADDFLYTDDDRHIVEFFRKVQVDALEEAVRRASDFMPLGGGTDDLFSVVEQISDDIKAIAERVKEGKP